MSKTEVTIAKHILAKNYRNRHNKIVPSVILVTNEKPTSNPTGVFTIPLTQFNNLAEQLGLSQGQLLRNIKGAKFSMDSEFVKAGEEWKNQDRDTGEEIVGKYTVDHWRHNNYEITLEPRKAAMLDVVDSLASNMQADLGSGISTNTSNSPQVTEEEEQTIELPTLLEEQTAEGEVEMQIDAQP